MTHVKCLVYTCDQYLWALQPFAYLFNLYWSSMQPVVVVGANPPRVNLPANFEFVSLGTRNYPAAEWSDGLIKFLSRWNEDRFVWLLEDYWLTRGCNHQAIASLDQYMAYHPDVLRIDLTADRLHSGHARDVDTWGYLDIIETDKDTPYQFSTQAAMVNRANMLASLKPGLAPWEFELQGNELIPEGMRVLGTRQWPLRYLNGIGMGCENKYRLEHVREGMAGRTVERIEPEHVSTMLARGILPPNEKL
jgi:hypothetical protein